MYIRTLACYTRSLKYVTCYMTVYFDLIVLSCPNCYLVNPFFMHPEYKYDHAYLLAFTATVLLNYLKFANKNKILPFYKL